MIKEITKKQDEKIKIQDTLVKIRKQYWHLYHHYI